MIRLVLAIALSPIAATLSADLDITPDESLPGVVLEGTEQHETGAPIGASAGSEGATTPPPQICIWTGQVRACDGELGVGMPGEPNIAAEIRRAVETVGLPALVLKIQPGGETLVNAATIFHTDAPVFQHSTVLLEQAVEITATPVRFTWHHGDATTQTTTTAGAPYPSMDVTHTYAKVADGLTPRVDVGYQVTYRVNGGASLEIDQLITAAGPVVSLDVAEAAPVIVAP